MVYSASRVISLHTVKTIMWLQNAILNRTGLQVKNGIPNENTQENSINFSVVRAKERSGLQVKQKEAQIHGSEETVESGHVLREHICRQ